jgi:hypothetical protein
MNQQDNQIVSLDEEFEELAEEPMQDLSIDDTELDQSMKSVVQEATPE